MLQKRLCSLRYAAFMARPRFVRQCDNRGGRGGEFLADALGPATIGGDGRANHVGRSIRG